MALRTGNPTLRESTFASYQMSVVSDSDRMTINGTVHRTFFLLCLVVGAAAVTWGLVFTNPALCLGLMGLGLIGGLITCLITCFKKEWSPVTAPIYAVLEGLTLGGISALYEQSAGDGIVALAVGLTFGVLFMLLALYRSGVVKATENLKLGLLSAMGGILLVSLGSIVMSFMGAPLPAIYDSGPIGIGFSLFVVVIAALNLVLDFDFIEKGVEYGAPKYMEWYAAFGLLVTLIWLYLEILRLLSKLNSRN